MFGMDEQQINSLFDAVVDFGTQLSAWNLKYDRFPDINEWLRKNWTAPYGKEAAESYLAACMAQRSSNYHNVGYSDGREKSMAYTRLKNVIADLKGDQLSPSRVSSTLRRIASAIENSKSPSRELVSRDLNYLVSRISSHNWNEVWEKIKNCGVQWGEPYYENVESFKKDLSDYLTDKNKFDVYTINAFLENIGMPYDDDTFKLAEVVASLYNDRPRR